VITHSLSAGMQGAVFRHTESQTHVRHLLLARRHPPRRRLFSFAGAEQWRHLGGGARVSADPPPTIVKCKSFALSVSSKGSLYISHNGR